MKEEQRAGGRKEKRKWSHVYTEMSTWAVSVPVLMTISPTHTILIFPSSQDPHKIKYFLEKHGESPRALMLGEGQREVSSLGEMKVSGGKGEEKGNRMGKQFSCRKDDGN